jgi:hypothetical protein
MQQFLISSAVGLSLLFGAFAPAPASAYYYHHGYYHHHYYHHHYYHHRYRHCWWRHGYRHCRWGY